MATIPKIKKTEKEITLTNSKKAIAFKKKLKITNSITNMRKIIQKSGLGW